MSARWWVVSGGKSRQVEDGPHMTQTAAIIAREVIKRELPLLIDELRLEVREEQHTQPGDRDRWKSNALPEKA